MTGPSPDGTAEPVAASLPDAELRALRDRARDAGDESLRRLVESYIMLRTLAAEMVTVIETREGAMTITKSPLFSRLRELTTRRK